MATSPPCVCSIRSTVVVDVIYAKKAYIVLAATGTLASVMLNHNLPSMRKTLQSLSKQAIPVSVIES